MSFATNRELEIAIRAMTESDIPRILKLERAIFPFALGAVIFGQQLGAWSLWVGNAWALGAAAALAAGGLGIGAPLMGVLFGGGLVVVWRAGRGMSGAGPKDGRRRA